MKETLLEEIERLHDLEKYQEIIDLIEALPAERLNTELIGKLASAYNNIENYEKALEILKTIEFEEGNSRLEESRQRQIKKNNEKEHGKSSLANDTVDRY